jgi:hypothetical protein
LKTRGTGGIPIAVTAHARESTLMVENFANLDNDPLTGRIIGCAIEVHRALGPALLESANAIPL